MHRLRPDLRGTILEGDNISLVRWLIPADGQPTGLHSHKVHEQFTIVTEGTVETRVGNEVHVLSTGDVCRVRAGVEHGCTRALNGMNAVLVDVFEPRREDYLEAAQSESRAGDAT